MSEPIPVSLTIGGPVPRRHLPEIAETLASDGLSLDGEGEPTPEEVRSWLQAATVHPLELYNHTANYGNIDDSLAVLEAYEIEYTHTADARYEHSGLYRVSRRTDDGYQSHEVYADQEGWPLIPVYVVQQALRERSTTQAAAAMLALDLLTSDVGPVVITDDP